MTGDFKGGSEDWMTRNSRWVCFVENGLVTKNSGWFHGDDPQSFSETGVVSPPETHGNSGLRWYTFGQFIGKEQRMLRVLLPGCKWKELKTHGFPSNKKGWPRRYQVRIEFPNHIMSHDKFA